MRIRAFSRVCCSDLEEHVYKFIFVVVFCCCSPAIVCSWLFNLPPDNAPGTYNIVISYCARPVDPSGKACCENCVSENFPTYVS